MTVVISQVIKKNAVTRREIMREYGVLVGDIARQLEEVKVSQSKVIILHFYLKLKLMLVLHGCYRQIEIRFCISHIIFMDF